MSNIEGFPADPGTYILFLWLSKAENIQVGSLRSWDFPRGNYAYTGSAQGPGGLGGRIRRHLRPHAEKIPHWHVDRLSAFAKITHVWWEASDFNHECSWAEKLAGRGSIPVPQFGSSDCGCPGHLIWLPTLSHQAHEWEILMELLGANIESAQI